MNTDINVKLLEMAKELLMLEYHDKKAQDHNRWLIESERAWRVSRTKLEHPSFPPFPTEALILEKANSLMNFVNSQKSKEELFVNSIRANPVAVIQETKEEQKPEIKEIISDESKPAQEPVVESVVESAVESVTEPVVEQVTEPVIVSTEVKEAASEESKSHPVESVPPTTDQSAAQNDGQKIPGLKAFNLPENLLEYTRIKVAHDMENRTPSSTRIITNILESLRRNNKS